MERAMEVVMAAAMAAACIRLSVQVATAAAAVVVPKAVTLEEGMVAAAMVATKAAVTEDATVAALAETPEAVSILVPELVAVVAAMAAVAAESKVAETAKVKGAKLDVKIESCPHLGQEDDEGNVDYSAFLERYVVTFSTMDGADVENWADGVIDEICRKLYTAMGTQDSQQAFAVVDTDKSGMVDINEFCRLLRVERSPFVERLFSMFDTDKTGLIDLKEFVVGLSNVGTEARENKVKFAFKVFDLDGSGSIDADELRKIVKATNMASEKQLTRKVEWLMKQCDTDGDGMISYDEFVNLSKKFPNIVFPAYSLASGLGGLSK